MRRELSHDRLLLRVELWHGRDTIVSYGFDLTPTSIFVVTDWQAEIDDVVGLRLSCPRVLEPIELGARVVEIHASGEPGEPGGLRLELDPPQPALAAQLSRLAARDTGGDDRPYRVLLVEDSWLTRDMFEYATSRFFQRPGAMAVDHVESAERAWAKLAEATYDIVIVDYFLPSEDGASLIRRLRADPRLAHSVVVAISMGGRDAREATLSAGADLFLDKPLVFRDLFTTLRALARRDQPRAQRKAILVFDDSPLALAITRSALETAGFEVAIAEDLASFERQRVAFDPDLILVDVQMPEAFGDDVASTLRGWHGVRVPILLVSSLEQNELALRASRARVTGYVWKGAGTSELVRRCKELLEVAR